MYINLTGTGDFRLSGQSNCSWLPDAAGVSYNCVFIGDHVVLTGSWTGDPKDDGLLRVVLDGTTIGFYYASHDLINDVWSIEVDITYALKNAVEPYTGWGGTVDPEGDSDTKTYTPRTLSVYTENNETVSCQVDIVILDGHKLSAMPHPFYDELNRAASSDVHSINAVCRVQPPNVVLSLNNPYIANYPIWVEMGDLWKDGGGYYCASNGINMSNGNGGSIGFRNGNDKLVWAGTNGKYTIKFQPVENRSCQNYALVRWKSKTGNWRQHLFEVENITDNIDSSTVIDNIGTSYRSLVENSYQFDIHLSGLTRYGLWYYQDILSSDEIYCCVGNPQAAEWGVLADTDGTMLKPAPSELLCSVSNPKKYAVPNETGKLYDFNCTLKYKKTSY